MYLNYTTIKARPTKKSKNTKYDSQIIKIENNYGLIKLKINKRKKYRNIFKIQTRINY